MSGDVRISQRSGGSRLAVVTGGAEGIGRVFARRLAEDGHDLIVVDRRPADETRMLVEAEGRSFQFLECDLEDHAQVTDLAARIVDRHGGCDVLVNNAGIASQRSFDSITPADVRRLLAINLEAPFLLAKGLVATMRQRGWGRIVNITSASLNLSIGGFVDYLISKSSLVGFTRALASDLGGDGITVNAIAPGLVRTPMTLGREGQPALPEMVFQGVVGVQAIKRSEVPEDLAGLLSFLASDDSAMVTGQVIVCDGGVVRV